MAAFDNPCVWIDLLNKNITFDYKKCSPCKDPTYLRNVKATAERLMANGSDIALFHFEDCSISVVYVADIPFNPALKRALEEAKNNMLDMIEDTKMFDSNSSITKRYTKHFEIIKNMVQGLTQTDQAALW